jgi:hypothetical protein
MKYKYFEHGKHTNLNNCDKEGFLAKVPGDCEIDEFIFPESKTMEESK